MKNKKETRHEYLAVLKYAYEKSGFDESLKVNSEVINEMMKTVNPSDEYKKKMRFIRLRNLLQEKISMLEVLGQNSPELMDLPIEASEIVNDSELEMFRNWK